VTKINKPSGNVQSGGRQPSDDWEKPEISRTWDDEIAESMNGSIFAPVREN